MSEEELFFNALLDKTKKVFLEESATRKKYPNQNWNYAICETPIQKNTGLFFGINWGGNNINEQVSYPTKYRDYGRKWNFIANSRRYFKEHFNAEIEDLNYSNLCFFRTPTSGKLVPSDFDLCVPLFKEYVDYINPPWTLMLGDPKGRVKKHVINFEQVSVYDDRNKKWVNGYTGILFGMYPFGSVPHTRAHISTTSRDQIWLKVKDQIDLIINRK